jgi:hypothetical protein
VIIILLLTVPVVGVWVCVDFCALHTLRRTWKIDLFVVALMRFFLGILFPRN